MRGFYHRRQCTPPPLATKGASASEGHQRRSSRALALPDGGLHLWYNTLPAPQHRSIDPAAVQIHDGFCNGQSQAQTPEAAGGLDPALFKPAKRSRA